MIKYNLSLSVQPLSAWDSRSPKGMRSINSLRSGSLWLQVHVSLLRCH